jgi:alpha-glucosidase
LFSHIKGGSIIPARINSTNTTTELRSIDFELLIAPGKDGKASGCLYLDDGESIEQKGISQIEFSYDGNKVVAQGTFGYNTTVGVKRLVVMGDEEPAKFDIDTGLTAGWEKELKQ